MADGMQAFDIYAGGSRMKVTVCLALSLLVAASASAGPILVEPVSLDPNAAAAAVQQASLSQTLDIQGLLAPHAASVAPPAASVERMFSLPGSLSIVDPAAASRFEYQGAPEEALQPGACSPDDPSGCAHLPEPATLLTMAAGLLGARMLARRKTSKA
jgi:hypothetical protein